MSESRPRFSSPEVAGAIQREFMPRPVRDLYTLEAEPVHRTVRSRVYKAAYKRDGHPVAIKFIPPGVPDGGGWHGVKEMSLACTTLLEADSPYLLPYEDIVCDDVLGFGLVTRWMEGGGLEMELDKTANNWDLASSYAIQIALGIGALKKLGIVHRDLKPDNIFVEKRLEDVHFSSCVVADFGISAPQTYLNQRKQRAPGQVVDLDVSDLWERRDTLNNLTQGTPCYMSPEQARGKVLDFSSDMFSLGIVLYEMVSGELPFDDIYDIASDSLPRRIHIRSGDPQKDSKRKLCHIISALLEKTIGDRGMMLDGQRLVSGDDVAHAIAQCWVDSGSDIERTPWFAEAMEITHKE